MSSKEAAERGILDPQKSDAGKIYCDLFRIPLVQAPKGFFGFRSLKNSRPPSSFNGSNFAGDAGGAAAAAHPQNATAKHKEIAVSLQQVQELLVDPLMSVLRTFASLNLVDEDDVQVFIIIILR